MGTKDYVRAPTSSTRWWRSTRTTQRYPDAQSSRRDILPLEAILSARRTFRLIVERGGEQRFAPYTAKALGRLVDVALRTKDYAALDDIFAQMNRVPPQAVTSGLAYARGKGLFVKKDYAGAKAALGSVDAKSEYVTRRATCSAWWR